MKTKWKSMEESSYINANPLPILKIPEVITINDASTTNTTKAMSVFKSNFQSYKQNENDIETIASLPLDDDTSSVD